MGNVGLVLNLTGGEAWEKELEGLGYRIYPSEQLQKAEVLVAHQGFIHDHLSGMPGLRFIQLPSAGYDMLPMEAIREKDILVSNARGVYSIPIAEWVVLKILEIYKETRFFDDNQRNRKWEKSRSVQELYGKTVGIVGTGSIGTETSKRLGAFGCRILGYSRNPGEKEGYQAIYHGFDFHMFLGLCDIVVLTLPLNSASRNLINTAALGAMKKDAVLVNISRGGIINQQELLRHLDQGGLKGVALDVFEEEPLAENHPFWEHPRVLVTPHNSFYSENIRGRLLALVRRNLQAYIRGERPENVIVG
ncbi:MAG: NAD(P)-dependent oxidoreductase [Clostridia bacterium]